jgi:hypothetical protein
MKTCRLCGKSLGDVVTECVFCGYDFNTDTVNQSFKAQPEKVAAKNREAAAKSQGSGARQALVSPAVKKFALIGLAVVIFSILLKNNFNVTAVLNEASIIFTKITTGKIINDKSAKKDDKENKKIELISVRSFKIPAKISRYEKLKVEGIFFDNDKSFIVINGRVVPEGKTFENVTVKKINSDTVELIAGGETKMLRVNQSIPFPAR